jgi:hypothetical protein
MDPLGRISYKKIARNSTAVSGPVEGKCAPEALRKAQGKPAPFTANASHAVSPAVACRPRPRSERKILSWKAVFLWKSKRGCGIIKAVPHNLADRSIGRRVPSCSLLIKKRCCCRMLQRAFSIPPFFDR